MSSTHPAKLSWDEGEIKSLWLPWWSWSLRGRPCPWPPAWSETGTATPPPWTHLVLAGPLHHAGGTWALHMQVTRRRSMWEGTRGRGAPFMVSMSAKLHPNLAPWERGNASDGVSSSLQPLHWASSIHFLSPKIRAVKSSWWEGRRVSVLTRQKSRNFPLLPKHFPLPPNCHFIFTIHIRTFVKN